MENTISIYTGLLLCLTVITSCNKTDQRTSENLPYPSVAEQRLLLANKPLAVPVRLLDSLQTIRNLEYLASEICEGRKPGTVGHAKAVARIVTGFRDAGVDSLDNSLMTSFLAIADPHGINIAGLVKGRIFPEKYIVISAHYDHLGREANGSIFYGADDNASSVACLLALAGYFKANPHPYSIIFVALDKEETGFEGAFNFVNYLHVSNRLSSVKFNLNMDMIARSDRNEIFVCGVKANPTFKYMVDEVQSKINVKLLMGHDGGSSGDDWSHASDHTAFDDKGVPFLYIGVEDHNDYHQTTDTYQKINYSSYIENCNMITLMVRSLRP